MALPCTEGIQGVFPVPPKLVLFWADVVIRTSLGTMSRWGKGEKIPLRMKTLARGMLVDSPSVACKKLHGRIIPGSSPGYLAAGGLCLVHSGLENLQE